MTVKPLGTKILLRIMEEEAPSKGGILLPKSTRKAYREAIVQAVGPRYKGELKPGNTVFHVPFTGVERIINREQYIFVKEFELLGVLN